MGEVDRATDTNLKRQVAIKVLPASVEAEAQRPARSQREAEVLAALNHRTSRRFTAWIRGNPARIVDEVMPTT
jgi:serine/threonine protein kinase